MTGRTWPAAQAGPCRFCGTISYRADGCGTVHECCLAWQRVMSFGYPCPACQVAEIVMRQLARMALLPPGKRRAVRLPVLPPLPRLLPDGTPYVPGLPPVPRCAACGHAMTVLGPGQRFHPLCQPMDNPDALFRPRPSRAASTRRSAA